MGWILGRGEDKHPGTSRVVQALAVPSLTEATMHDVPMTDPTCWRDATHPQGVSSSFETFKHLTEITFQGLSGVVQGNSYQLHLPLRRHFHPTSPGLWVTSTCIPSVPTSHPSSSSMAASSRMPSLTSH